MKTWMPGRHLALLVVGVMALSLPPTGAADPAKKEKTAAPKHQVIACYFHRTQRCPTCMRISAYIEETIKTRFAEQLKDGRVKWVMIDFQDPANAKYTESYNIQGPTLAIIDVKDGKVKEWKPAPRVWTLVRDKESFGQYVETEVRAYLDAK
jgi:hypothetical protein